MFTYPNKDKKTNFTDFFNGYSDALIETTKNIDKSKLDLIFKSLKEKIVQNKKIFTVGNGGSASVANHFLCDFNKGIKLSSKNKLKPKVISLSNSIELITAIGNDLKYEKIFSSQMENYMDKGDCLLAFSCSGSSKNILNVIKFAIKNKVDTIFITGFSKKKFDNCLHLDLGIKNYGISEDIFSIIMHTTSQYIRYNSSKKNNIL
tara:strand:+ start:23775 stop:24389 length:615 start_codon:yes stop_codon:yes gene_type:complete